MQGNLFSPADGGKSSSIRSADLNPPQYEAVTTMRGPVLVIAGAGSGKTRTLVYRVAHLLEQGVPPEEILLLTFTRKSAAEMLARGSELLDDSCRRVVGGTFHAVASGILRRYGHLLGYTPQFTILDRGDAEGIVNLLKSSLDLGGVGRSFPTKRAIINIFSQIINKRQSLDEIINQRYWHLSDYIEDIARIKRHYGQFKLEHNLMDYDDLLVNLRRLLFEFPEAAELIAGRFSYIMVDEYQDTNHIQAEIVSRLAASHQNVMAVGDDSQSIYSFRGADFRNIMDFPKIFPRTKLIRLEENYRSTQPILSLTNSIIDHAAEKYSKELFTSISGGEKPVLYAARNDADQASYVGRNISKLLDDGVPMTEIAVLFRSGFHSYKLELDLTSRQLPFEKRGGLKLTESAHIKDITAYLRVIYNPSDHLAWNRILLLLDKVGPKTALKILAALKVADPFGALAAYKAGKTWREGLRSLVQTLFALLDCATPLAQFDLAMQYYQPIFERIYHDDYPNRKPDLEQLREIIAGYDDLESFIEDAALDPPAAAGDRTGQGGQLVLSTVHSAKGLEWQVVFVISLVEGKFPSAMAKTTAELEEERRLLYVACTRAKERLYLVYPEMSASPGHFAEPAMVSRFLDELPAGLTLGAKREIRFAPHEAHTGAVVMPQTAKKIAATADNLLNRHVRHPFFGAGQIVKQINQNTVQIFFARHGQKTINLDYVKMEILP
ncbi:MAG: ATP-dependent helicase [Deltaproteobacteria bacterium]|nr:ATP-dependent helicase [Deltaproteobacteria bacterium]